MDALDVEMSLAEGEQALQALLQFAQEQAGTLEAHEAEKGIFKRLLPIGLAAMKLYFAQRGTGDVGPAVTRADGMILPREKPLRGRDYFSLFGKFAVARTFNVKKPRHLCTPVDKNGEGIKKPAGHLICYKAKPARGQPKHTSRTVFVADQFGQSTMTTRKEAELCVPSTVIP